MLLRWRQSCFSACALRSGLDDLMERDLSAAPQQKDLHDFKPWASITMHRVSLSSLTIPLLASCVLRTGVGPAILAACLRKATSICRGIATYQSFYHRRGRAFLAIIAQAERKMTESASIVGSIKPSAFSSLCFFDVFAEVGEIQCRSWPRKRLRNVLMQVLDVLQLEVQYNEFRSHRPRLAGDAL